MQTKQMLCRKICEAIRSLTELPEDFTYDYPLSETANLVSGVMTISYAMYESNVRANAFREETLNMLNPTVTVSENYFLQNNH